MDSKVEENYKRLREKLNERLNNDKRLTEIMDKISKGTATFKDSAEYSQIVADHMGDVISKNIGNIKIPMGKEMVCKELLKENIERVDTVFGKVQVSVDEKMGIHLNPVTPPYPTERVNAIAHSLEDPNADDEKVARRGKSSGNVVAARHDENVKANAAWREKAGFDCYLVRDAGGGCCAWCQALEGRYEYASAPDDIFRRHDNCTCTVTYECGKMRQDVWSKRTWQASEKELEQRKALSEASKPTVNTPEQAKELERQALEKNPVTKLSPEQAQELENKILGNVNKNDVDNGGKSGIIESGARYGAYNDKNDPNNIKREASAERYYEEIRNRDRNAEIEAISQNTGFSKDDVDAIFSHVFEQEHPFEDGTTHRFVPDYYMQQSFMRIREGKNIQKHDITLLNHELAEYKLMSANPNMVYEEAHAIVEKQYNYAKELLEYLKEKSKKEG